MDNSSKTDIKFIVNIKYHKYYEKPPTLETCKNDINTYEKELQLYNQSQFYRCTKGYNVISYLTRKGAIDNLNSDVKHMIQALESDATFNSSEQEIDMVNYAQNRPGSTGLFDAKGDIPLETIKALRENLKQTKSNIWSGVLSFTQEYGNKACNKREDAINIIKNTIQKLFTAQGLKSENMNYYCAYHTNTTHPHIHFVYWEKNPLNLDSKGVAKYSYSKFDELKKATNVFKSSVLKYCESLGKLEDYSQRDVIKNYFKSDDLKSRNLNRILQLRKELGEKYSYQYARLNNEQRLLINTFIDEYISSNPTLKSTFDLYIQKLAKTQHDINLHHAEQKIPLSKAASMYSASRINELYSRCGNEILKMIKAINQELDAQNSSKEINDFISNYEKYNSNYHNKFIITEFMSNELPKDGYYNQNEIKASILNLNQNLSLTKPKQPITKSFEELFKLLKARGWKPRTLEDIETEQKEFLQATKDEEIFKSTSNNSKKELSPLNKFYKKYQKQCQITINDSLEDDRNIFAKFGISFVKIQEPAKIHYKILKNKSNSLYKYTIKKYQFNQETTRYIFASNNGCKSDYFLTPNLEKKDSFVYTLKKLGLSTKEILSLATQVNPNGLAFKLITQTSSLDSTCMLLKKKFEKENNNNWFNKTKYNDKGFKSVYSQSSKFIYQNNKNKRTLINLLSHLISDHTFIINQDINEALKEFYSSKASKGEISIYGEQE